MDRAGIAVIVTLALGRTKGLPLIVLLLPLLLSGCLSFSSSDPKPPESRTTVTVPSLPQPSETR
jgi:hypothetical protein